MPLIFEQFHTPGIAALSYALGDDSARVAAVIDPRPDVDIYLEWAQSKAVVITHIFETHIHADFMSGARELARRLGAGSILVSEEDAGEYGFEHRGIRDGDSFDFGDFRLTARHTPGHTPEHVSLLASEDGRHDTPFAVFSGDTLFVDSVGRPDLLGDDATKELAGKLFESIRGFYLKLSDNVIVYPGHGAGSACGPDIGDRNSTTIGYERRHNKYLGIEGKDAFIEKVLDSAPPEPRHYKPLKKINAGGPETFGQLPLAPGLTPNAFAQAVENGGALLVDTRNYFGFGGGHIAGALNIEARAELSVWAGWMLPYDRPLLLVIDETDSIDRVVRLFWRTGYTRFSGYLAGGMTAWSNEGMEIESVSQVPVHVLRKKLDSELQIVDVRTPEEWESGYIPNACHIFAPELRERVNELDRDRPVATYCATGFRASIAASLLLQEGFRNVTSVSGSWQAWQAEDYPEEKPTSD